MEGATIQRIRLAVAVMLLATACLVGCGTTAFSPTHRAAPDALSPTASRLHDLCGSLLLFHGVHQRMPRSLAELRQATGLEMRQVLDPSTGRPFAYAPDGVMVAGEDRRIVLYAAPVEGEAYRWCVLVADAGRLLQTDVAPVPIHRFSEPASRPAGGER